MEVLLRVLNKMHSESPLRESFLRWSQLYGFLLATHKREEEEPQ